jgi:glucan phosphoethanolaminetransferase (alkaline phosphatase superfamily)
MKDKGFKILFGIFALMFLLDLISTLVLGKELIQYLESNPLYPYGGLLLITGINIVFMGLYWWMYHKTSNPSLRFVIMFGMIAVIITRVIVVWNNYQVYLNPPTIQQAMQVTTAMKMEVVKKNVSLNFLPFFNAILTWFFFKMDHFIYKEDPLK